MKTPKIIKGLLFAVGLIVICFSAYQFVGGLFEPAHAGYVMDHIVSPGLANVSYAGFSLALIQDADLNAWQMQDGEENMGGFPQVMYLGLRSHITGYPTEPADNATTFDQMVELSGDYAFAQGKHFIKILVAPNSAGFNPEGQGDYPGTKSFKIAGTFVIPGMKNQHRAIARLMNNAYGILIIPQDDGSRLAFGTEGRPVHFLPKGKSGDKPADAKQFTYEFNTDSHVPGFTYKGVIALDGVTLPAVS